MRHQYHVLCGRKWMRTTRLKKERKGSTPDAPCEERACRHPRYRNTDNTSSWSMQQQLLPLVLQAAFGKLTG